MKKILFWMLSIVLAACQPTQVADVAGRALAPAIDPAIEKNVADLLSKMTLDEKIGQMAQINDGALGSEAAAIEAIKAGRIGSILNLKGAELVNKAQKVAVEQSRLGIPLLIGRDVIHGFRTVFPIPLGMAASWNPEAVRGAMRIAAAEASSEGIRWTFAPMIDITWDPRWGRIAESCGEDPLLASVLGQAMIRGFQGDNPANPHSIAACAKHFVGYGMSEAGRDYNTTYIPEPLLRNVHLRPFAAAVEADALTFMSAFNDLNGVPASGNAFTLKQVLRKEWGFKGMVVSDWASITEMIDHGFAADTVEAAYKGFSAGVDMEMASTSYAHLKGLLEKGLISEKQIDEAVANILRVKFRLGLFDQPYTTPDPNALLQDSALLHAKRLAEESMVLLKNENEILPLSADKRVALIGPLADSPRDQLGTWVFDGDSKDSRTPRQAFEQQLGNKLLFAPGLGYSRDKSTEGFDAALKAAKAADVVVFVGGEEAALSGEANARGIIDLPGRQHELLARLKALGKPVVLVVMAGRPLAIGAELETLDAVLYAWHPGTMAGPALYDVLTGAVVPSGKLPVTFVKGAGQIPFYYYRKNTGRPASASSYTPIDSIPRNSPQLSLGFKSFHLDYGFTPLLPFGYGLSYTSFGYQQLQLSATELSATGELTVSAQISNIGQRDGQEVVQLYVRDHAGSITRPIKELKGFQKIALKTGESKTVSFTLRAKDLEFFNGEKYLAEPGKFSVWIASHSDDNRLVAQFELK